MKKYRIGNPGTEMWWGMAFHLRWGTFEAENDEAAWEKGQQLAAGVGGWGPDSGMLLALERQEAYPNPRILSGLTMHSIEDLNPEGFVVWVRVAVGIHNAPWEKETPLEIKGSNLPSRA